MTVSWVAVIYCLFFVNLLLQFLDGTLTYYFLSMGAPELNPLLHATIASWGPALGLFYWKMLACFLLLVIFVLRGKRPALITKALALTATVYTFISLLELYEFFAPVSR
jgi:hypothetical protein